MTNVEESFELASADQRASPLLALPAELISKVLHFLMNDDWVVETKKRFLRREELYVGTVGYRKGKKNYAIEVLQRGAQVLRVCQQLYHEGCNVLYKSNYLQFEMLITGDGRTLQLSVLDIDVTLPAIYESPTFPYRHYDLYTYSCDRKEAEFRKLLDIYPALARCQVYDLKISYRCQEHVHVPCQLLKNLLHDKDVYITMCHKGVPKLTMLEKVKASVGCKILRCRYTQRSGAACA